MTKPLVQATGRRKASVARVRLRDGSGAVTLNGKPLEQFFPTMSTRMRVMEPLQLTNMVGRYDLEATLHGGGTTGQSDALRLGIARALIVLDPDLRPTLKAAGMLSRDDRVVESKKYGLRKARRAPQYTKR
ncbi:MAG: 30S ribosomal protein S9 [Acidimicrobiia bacterium]